MLKEKSKQTSDLDGNIISLCKLEEIYVAETLKMRVLDPLANISLTTMASKTIITYTTTGGSTTQFSGHNPCIPTGSVTTPPSTQALQTLGSPPTSPALPSLNQTSQNSGTPPNTNAATSKLQKLTLLKFRGKVTQFKPFWDTFESELILSKIVKFNYLAAQLREQRHAPL